MPKGIKAVKVEKEILYDLYVVKRYSYREIMKLINVNSARTLKKWLIEYGIPIRTGSEAVKTQWENNIERKKSIGKTFSNANKGKISSRRLADSVLFKRLDRFNVEMINKMVVGGYTVIECRCKECDYRFTVSLKKLYGCRYCAIKRNVVIHRTPFETVEEEFNKNDMVLLDTDYINVETPMSFICINHVTEGIQKRTFASVKRLGKCKFCRIEERHKDKINDRERLNYQLRRWRKAVYERDKYTCQCCGDSKGGNLNAHHIQNFSTHKHLRFDIDNGITLCQECHNPNKKGSFHYIYGTHNNNAEQLKEYIKTKKD